MLIGIFIGVLIWQTIITIVLLATNEDEEKTIYVGGGIPLLIIVGIGKVIYVTKRKIRYFSVRSILTDENGNWFYCRPEIVEKLREDEDRNLDFPRWTDELKLQYPRDMWSEYIQKNCCTFDVGNFRYAPKEIWSKLSEIK